ncbi:MAG TPA: hypothetical protein VHY31_28425 [Streptosporangiaceae bacterium]|jgi:hypothetical protein|nr:hypothetical protein [Streptosporangiaceae bacterium]
MTPAAQATAQAGALAGAVLRRTVELAQIPAPTGEEGVARDGA